MRPTTINTVPAASGCQSRIKTSGNLIPPNTGAQSPTTKSTASESCAFTRLLIGGPSDDPDWRSFLVADREQQRHGGLQRQLGRGASAIDSQRLRPSADGVRRQVAR